MQFLRIAANKMHDEHACVMDVDPYEAGVLKITDKGERLLSIYAMPGITYHILDDKDKLDTIRW